MENTIKKYSNGVITVVWRPSKCIHSKICWEKATGLPEVFNPQMRPWIDVYAAETDEIIAQVKKCPTTALSYYRNSEGEKEEEIKSACDYEDEVFVQIMKNGPLMIFGDIRVKDPEGNEILKKNITAFCRCGASKTNPYCDGTHHDVNFVG
jgi:uncharacterized Fe-S cluster protein YjdI